MLADVPRLVERQPYVPDYGFIFTVLSLCFLLFMVFVMYIKVTRGNLPDADLYKVYHDIVRIANETQPVARFPERDYFRWDQFIKPWGISSNSETAFYDNRN